MDFSLNEEQKRLREDIIRFAQKELNEGVKERDRELIFSRDLWEKCGEMELQGLPIPEEYGGRALDPLSTAIALEAFGYGCQDGGLVFSLCANLLACMVPIWKHGSEEQKRRYLPGLSDGSLIAVNGMTETSAGSDAFSMSTHAEVDGEGFRLNGKKTYGSNGPVADLAVIYALTDSEKGAFGGVTAFLVESDIPGYKAGPTFEKMGLRTCTVSELVLEDVYVPKEAVLGEVGGGTRIFNQSMEWERICLVASHIGTMERVLEDVIEHARTRTASGQPIGKFQAVSHQVADMKVRLEAARLLTYKAASRLDRTRSVAMDASIAKLYVSEALVQTSLDAVQIFGGSGFMTDNEVERALRDAVGSTLYSGTSEVQRNIIARWLGL